MPARVQDFPVVGSFDELLAMNPDVVSICSPPWAHAEQAIAVLEHGCHVLVEKPMAMNVEEAERMAAAAERSGKLLCVAHSHLFDQSIVRAGELLDSGALGELVSVQAVFFRGKLREGKAWLYELPGGLVFDELPHPIYLLERFLGRTSLGGTSILRTDGRETPRQVQATLTGETASGQISMVMDAPVSEWHLIVTGTRRMVIADLFRDILVELPPDGAHTPMRVIGTSVSAVTAHAAGLARSGWKYMRKRLYYGHDTLIEQLMRAVEFGEPCPVTLESALRTQQMVNRIIEQPSCAAGEASELTASV